MPLPATVKLLRRSSKTIDETATKRAVRWGWTAPDPGPRMAVELGSGEARDVGEVVVVGQGLTGKRCAPQDAPPAFDEIEPGGPHGNQGVGDARMVRQPVPDRSTEVAGEVVGDQVQVALRIRLIE